LKKIINKNINLPYLSHSNSFNVKLKMKYYTDSQEMYEILQQFWGFSTNYFSHNQYLDLKNFLMFSRPRAHYFMLNLDLVCLISPLICIVQPPSWAQNDRIDNSILMSFQWISWDQYLLYNHRKTELRQYIARLTNWIFEKKILVRISTYNFFSLRITY